MRSRSCARMRSDAQGLKKRKRSCRFSSSIFKNTFVFRGIDEQILIYFLTVTVDIVVAQNACSAGAIRSRKRVAEMTDASNPAEKKLMPRNQQNRIKFDPWMLTWWSFPGKSRKTRRTESKRPVGASSGSKPLPAHTEEVAKGKKTTKAISKSTAQLVRLARKRKASLLALLSSPWRNFFLLPPSPRASTQQQALCSRQLDGFGQRLGVCRRLRSRGGSGCASARLLFFFFYWWCFFTIISHTLQKSKTFSDKGASAFGVMADSFREVKLNWWIHSPPIQRRNTKKTELGNGRFLWRIWCLISHF